MEEHRILGQSVPNFFLGMGLMWFFAAWLVWLPTSGKWGFFHIILPAITLAMFQVAALLRLTRTAMLEVLDTEYVKLARIKGIPEWKVLWKHSLRDVFIAPLTYFAIIIRAHFTGTVVVETVFAWPGEGQLAVNSVFARDFSTLRAVVIIGSAIYVTGNMLADKSLH